MLLGAWGVYIAFGALIALNGALVPLIRADLGLSLSQMGVILGAWQFVYIATAIPSGRFIDWIGVRLAITISAIIMLSSAALRATATGFWSLLVPVAAFGLGAPIISVGAPKVAASLFEGSDRRKAVALYGTAPGVGGVLALVTSTNVIGPFVDDSWKAITLIITAVASVALVVWLVVSKDLDGLIAPGGGPNFADYFALARRPVVSFVLTMAILGFFTGHGIGQWLVAILSESGWSNDEATIWAAGGTFVGLVAAFTVPRFADARRRQPLLMGVLLIGALGAVMLLATNTVVLAFAIGAAAIPRVVVMPLLVMMLMDHKDVGPANIAAATGLFFSLSQIGGVTGPAVTGALADSTGSFQTPLFVHGAVLLAMAAGLAFGYNRVAASRPS